MPLNPDHRPMPHKKAKTAVTVIRHWTHRDRRGEAVPNPRNAQNSLQKSKNSGVNRYSS